MKNTLHYFDALVTLVCYSLSLSLIAMDFSYPIAHGFSEILAPEPDQSPEDLFHIDYFGDWKTIDNDALESCVHVDEDKNEARAEEIQKCGELSLGEYLARKAPRYLLGINDASESCVHVDEDKNEAVTEEIQKCSELSLDEYLARKAPRYLPHYQQHQDVVQEPAKKRIKLSRDTSTSVKHNSVQQSFQDSGSSNGITKGAVGPKRKRDEVDNVKSSTSKDSRARALKHFCSQCDMGFPDLTKLKRHESCHSDERNFRCPWPNCASTYKTKGNLKDHIKNVHENIEQKRNFSCTFAGCSKLFSTNAKLNAHTKQVHSDIEFLCSKCDQRFRSKGSCTRHEKKYCPFL